MKTVLHIIPKSGGVADYSQVLGSIYKKIKGIRYCYLAFDDSISANMIFEAIQQSKADYVHFEIGGIQSNFFWASRKLAHINRAHMVTIHDTSIVITRPSGWQLPRGRSPHVFFLKILRKLLDKSLRYTIVRTWLDNSNIQFITLRNGALARGSYLPQATYMNAPPKITGHPHTPFRYGFAGYWSENKGLDTLLDAFIDMNTPLNDTKLIIYGGGYAGDDVFIQSFAARAKKVPGVSLPGEIPAKRMMSELGAVDVIVLPYWFNNPAGASAIAMRAAELGIPVVATRAPQLVETLSGFARYFEPDTSKDALRNSLVLARKNYKTSIKRARDLQAKTFKKHSHAVVKEHLEALLKRQATQDSGNLYDSRALY